jgi:NTE family protein
LIPADETCEPFPCGRDSSALWIIGVLLALALLTTSGCARDFLNKPLRGQSSNTGLLSTATMMTVAPDEPYIVMSLSGGGVRATGLGYAVLNELRQVPDRSGHSLADEIRIISSASGGSVAAAWFGLEGSDGLPALRDNFIVRDNMTALVSQVFNPVTLARLTGPSYSRIDVLREYFDRALFHGKTYADMYRRPGAPLVILNATDMATGEVFSFLPSRFDDLCSDLSSFPLAGAVAASAAFPVALTPISLKNWSAEAGCPVTPYPPALRSALTASDRFTNLAKYKTALETQQLRGCAYPCPDPTRRSPTVLYRHLLDGGLVDNLGTSAILQELFSNDPSSQLRQLNNGQIHNLVAIEVIARSSKPSPLSTNPATPGIISMVGSVIDNPINSATRGNSTIFQDAVSNLRRDGQLRNLAPAAFSPPSRVYSVQVDPDQFDATDPAQAALRNAFEQVPTSWTMDAEAFQTVQDAAHRLLYLHPCFVRLVMDRSTASPETLARGTPLGNPAACDFDAAAQTPAHMSDRSASAGR